MKFHVEEMDSSFVPYRVAAGYLDKRLKDAGLKAPVVGIICGSGLSGLSGALEGETLTVQVRSIHSVVQSFVRSLLN